MNFSAKTAVYQVAQIREFESDARTRYGLVGDVLMQRAGKAAFDFIQRRWPQAQHTAIFCGAGNNGGDGYVVAKLLHQRGMRVMVYQVGDHSQLKEEALQAYHACRYDNVPMTEWHDGVDLGHPDLVIDALLGIGLKNEVRDPMRSAIVKMQQCHAPIFAIDIPSGVEADTGVMLGEAIRATATITFIGVKLGLLTGQGAACTGELVLNDLQLPSELFSEIKPALEKIDLDHYAAYLKPRPRDWHKGLSGHVLVIGGDQGFSGASLMAAEAALRVGAGLVSVATHPESAPMMNVSCPEIMCHPVHAPADMEPLLKRADMIVLGPGLGQSEWGRSLFEALKNVILPMVVDADALNWLSALPRLNDNWILTPHPGEASRLLHTTTAAISANRLMSAQTIQKEYGGVVVLKGAGTIITTAHALPAICDRGNPGMSSAGMGDILSGVIGGLVAQRVPLFDAAKLGVYLHASAGDMAAREGERGTIATDLLPYLRQLANYSKQK